MTIGPSNPDDLAQILQWLAEEHRQEGNGFHSHAGMIEQGHVAGDKLYVLRVGSEVAAFSLGAAGSIDIFETRPDFRDFGYGRTLAQWCIDRAYDADIAVMEFECSPETSLPFWKKMGFSQRLARYGDNPWVMKKLAKKLDVPEGTDIDVTIRVLNKEYCYQDNIVPIEEHQQLATVDCTGIIWLPTRVVIFAPELGIDSDVAVEIIVDGKRRVIGKAKHEGPRGAGVLRDRLCNFYIDKIIPPSSP